MKPANRRDGSGQPAPPHQLEFREHEPQRDEEETQNNDHGWPPLFLCAMPYIARGGSEAILCSRPAVSYQASKSSAPIQLPADAIRRSLQTILYVLLNTTSRVDPRGLRVRPPEHQTRSHHHVDETRA